MSNQIFCSMVDIHENKDDHEQLLQVNNWIH